MIGKGRGGKSREGQTQPVPKLFLCVSDLSCQLGVNSTPTHSYIATTVEYFQKINLTV